MKIEIEAAFDSDVGRHRERNEDNCYFDGAVMKQEHEGPPAPLYKVFEPDGVFFAIFDGMGGVEGGEVASYLAGRTFQEACAHVEHRAMLSESFFHQAVEKMNDTVCYEARQRGSQMGTTFVSFAFCEETVCVCNVGDSRAYRLRDGVLTQLSVDDVGVARQTDRGKPGLTQCIGAPSLQRQPEPHLLLGRVRTGDVYLLCSDGLTDMVPQQEIADTLHTARNAEICTQKLVDHALDLGGRDNVTVIVMRVIENAADGGR